MTMPNDPQPQAPLPPAPPIQQQAPYGAPGPQAYPAGYGQPGFTQPRNGLGVASLVCGIVGVVLFFIWVLAVILGILAVVFGGVGIARANKGEATNKTMAIWGLALGIIAIIAAPVLVFAVLASA